jgi:16S rRNA (cytosine1407-C5)-methyltransferase
VNLLKASMEAVTAWGKEHGWSMERIPWCEGAFFIDRDDRSTALGKDLLHLIGATYMQEAASMLPVSLLGPKPGESILDLCAAPGSKTTQIASMLKGWGVIVCNDVQEKRLWTLKSSLYRCGVRNAVVMKKVGQWWSRHMTERFDRVLCDAPCTAQGTVRKDSDALRYTGEENIAHMARLQVQLLEAAVHCAKVGGRIVYSTCTLSPQENEAVCLHILNKFCDQLEIVDPRELRVAPDGFFERSIEDSIRVQHVLAMGEEQPFLRLWPQTYDTEGFFCAVFQKKAPTREVESLRWVRFQEDRLPIARERDIADALQCKYNGTFFDASDALYQRKEQILLSTKSVEDFGLPTEDYALGLPFCKLLSDGRVRIAHEAATLRGLTATSQMLTLSDEQLSLFLQGKDAPCDTALYGDLLLLYSGFCIGRGLAKEGKLKNNLPREMIF